MNNPNKRATDLTTTEKRALLEQLLRKKANKSGSYPLSYAQQRLWFLDQWQPESSFYNIALALRLTGTLNIRALELSLNEIVQRHEALRTTFVIVDGQPAQIITPKLKIPMPMVDLVGIGAISSTADAFDARATIIKQLVATEGTTAFRFGTWSADTHYLAEFR